MKIAASVAMLFAGACATTDSSHDVPPVTELCAIVDKAHGTVGVAFVSDRDTITINNGVRYPLMSVFKLHQALAVTDAVEHNGTSLDSILYISANELDPDTWSPMVKSHGIADISISVGSLIDYAVVSSDNNASNILFDHIASPIETDRYIRSIAPDTTFAIKYSEAQMKENHQLAYSNYSSPLSAALLIKQVFTSQMLTPENQDAITKALTTVTTGHDRIGAPIMDIEGLQFGHKTGSGYRNASGELCAFNDVAYIRLPDGRDYVLAVMIRDFAGSETEAAAIMAQISQVVYNYVQAQLLK